MTSSSHPIRVDFLPQAAHGLRGRIGLTFAPGKKDPAKGWDRDLGEDLQRLRETYKTNLLVSLVEEHELKLLDIENLESAARGADVRITRFPIGDARVPEDATEVVDLVRTILAVAGVGDTFVIHCRGGLGRAGTIAACCLVALGRQPDDVMRSVRAARPGAIENSRQEQFIRDFVATWSGSPSPGPSLSRFTGCLLGGAIGDALGYPVEFLKTQRDLDRVLGRVVPERLPHAEGRVAVVSDDTQMTLFTAEGLLRAFQRGRDRGICRVEGVVHRAYQRWLHTQGTTGAERWDTPMERGWLLDVRELHASRAPGNTCLSALKASLRGGDLPTIETPPNDSKGCGAPMRAAPVGLAVADVEEAFRLARDTAVLTHGHPSGYLSAAYFAAVIHGVARDQSLADAMARADLLLRKERGADEVVRAVDGARAGASDGVVTREVIERLGGGWVAEEALAIALFCALTVADGSPGYVATALWKSVAHAGDSDSTGSMTGNLLGAMYGREGLPEAWLADLEMRDVIERVASDLHTAFVLRLEPEFLRYPPT
jgi:ADP-ribosylglycohydrolase/protein-tyrosine phosphatase